VFFFCSFLFAMPLAFYYIFANGYLTEVGHEKRHRLDDARPVL
jgi:hypothetical protein